jgi:phosphoglucosamine mutase
MGDGMLTALMMARVISAKKSSLSELAARIPRFPQIMANVPANKEQKMMLVENEALKDLISEYENSLNSMNGRMLVRPSGTEQLIRITMWGTNEKEIQSIMDEFVVKINKILKGAAA